MSSRIVRRAAAAALVFACAVPLGACSSKETKFKNHLERAAEYDAKNQTTEALLELRSALQLDPKSAEVNYRIAEQLAKKNDYGNAVFFYRETTRLDPTRTDAALAEAKLILFEDNKRAEELISKVIEREPNNVLAYVRKSESALARNDSAAALQAALTASEIAPKDGFAQMQLGIVNLARVREFSLKGQPIPDDVYADAEHGFQRAAEAFPTGHSSRIELGRLYTVWPGHTDQAQAAFKSALEVAATPASRAIAADAAISFARATKRTDFLLYALHALVEAEPGNLDAWDALASLEESQTKGAGDAIYQKLLADRPNDINAHLHYAAYLVKTDRTDQAYAHLEEQANKGVEPAVALEEIVRMRLRANEVDQARTVVERLTKEYPTHPRTDRAKARLALEEGRLDEAADTLRRYLGNEETWEGQRLLAMAELRRGGYPAAVAAIDRALQLATDSRDDLLRLKATIHAAAGDHPQVVQTLTRLNNEAGVLSENEKLLMAQSLYAMGRRPSAKATLESILAGDKPPIGAYTEFALREGAREPQRARDYLTAALERQPTNASALRLMAQFDLAEGKPNDALARIDKAGAAGPLTPPLLLLRAQILASTHDYAKAEEEARRAFAAAPALPGALELLASIYVAQNRQNEAIASFEEAEKAGALPTSGQQLLARLYLAANRPNDAKPLYEKVIAARADLPGAKNDLAWLLASEGTDLERALTLAQEAQQAEPESAEVADTLGYVYMKKQLYDPALEQFKYAIELAGRSTKDAVPDRPEYHYHQGLALQALGRGSEAAAAFEAALALDGKFANADDARRQLEATKSAAASGPG